MNSRRSDLKSLLLVKKYLASLSKRSDCSPFEECPMKLVFT
jgi:hypothetical protein